MSSKPFDASLKDVVERHAADWVRLFGPWHVVNVRVLDFETSAVTSAADKAIEVDSGPDAKWILHPEFVSGYKSTFSSQIWWYNAVLHERHHLPAVSIALLLRRQADGPEMNGRYDIRAPHEAEAYHLFRYRVERLWQWPAERLLGGGLGALPLALLTDDAAESLPKVIRRIDDRLQAEASLQEREHLMALTALLMGLRHAKDSIHDALKGASNMWNSVLEDSSIVQDWLSRAKEEGKAEESRRFLLRMGQVKFGPPDVETTASIENMSDVDRLEELGVRLLTTNSWQELLSR